MSERAPLEAARAGDEDAFRALIEPHRERLQAHCRRMLNAVQDAEDALQETLLRAWRGLGSFRGRSTIGSWLYTIATNACLRILETRRRRPLELDAELGEEVGDPRPTPDTGYEQRETVELAFAAALRYLPPRQRVVLVLREVLAFTAAESAEILATTVQAVNSALQRARRTLDERFAELTDRAGSEAGARAKAQRLVASLAQGDVAAIVAGLDERARAMSPGPGSDLTPESHDLRVGAPSMSGHKFFDPTVLLRGGDSAGAVSMIENRVPPRWEGPPLHHHDFDEAFYVLAGELTFRFGDDLDTRKAGELAFAPRGVHHAFANPGESEARTLLICTPAGFERYFQRMAARQAGVEPPPEALEPWPEVTTVGPRIGEEG